MTKNEEQILRDWLRELRTGTEEESDDEEDARVKNGKFCSKNLRVRAEFDYFQIFTLLMSENSLPAAKQLEVRIKYSAMRKCGIKIDINTLECGSCGGTHNPGPILIFRIRFRYSQFSGFAL